MIKAFFASLLIFAAIIACGRDEDFDRDLPTEIAGPTLVLNEEGQSTALPSSYIVAFRGEGTETLKAGRSFRSLYQRYAPRLKKSYLWQSSIKDLNFLTAIDLGFRIAADWEWLKDFNPPLALLSEIGMKRSSRPPIGALTEVTFVDEKSARGTLELWEKQGKIWFAEPNYYSENQYRQYNELYQASTESWHRDIALAQAMAHLTATYGSERGNPVIAVMDSGVDSEHEALNKRMFDNTLTGRTDCGTDIHGCNTTSGKKDKLGDGDTSPFNLQEGGACPNPGNCDKDCCHGTHVAGIIAAHNEDSTEQQVAGVCPMCRIMAIRVMGKVGSSSSILDSSIIRGMIYVTSFPSDKGGLAVRILNASFGKFQRSRAVGAMVRTLKDTSNGVLVIGAAGNEDSMKRTYPAAFADAIAVSNISTGGAKAVSSNFGPWVDIAAPGQSINSTVPGGTYESKDGTSMAAPVVAGVAGLLLSADSSLSFGDLRKLLLETANASRLYDENEVNSSGYYPPVGGTSVRIPLLGTGMLDAEAAVKGDFSGTIASAEAIRRVDNSCGVIGIGKHHHIYLIYFFILPLLLRFGLVTKKKS